jgi:solute carrier family 23 (nucleobase transporter), member 1
MLVFGIFSKFGGLMATMPDPIVGGLYCGIFGMITAGTNWDCDGEDNLV